jgi:tripartite-type tricarboxylate transporter receptor subunit TctC
MATAALSAAVVSFMATLPAAADDAADFFKGKTVAVVVPAGPGGTYQVYGQLVQRHLGSHIPGNPALIVQNRPGAGGALAAAYMMNAAPHDGTVIAEISPGTITEPLFRPAVKYDVRKFNWLGSISVRSYVLAVWHTVPVKTIQDLRHTKVTFGTTGKGSTGFQFPSFVNHALGTKIDIIPGYKGGGDIDLAIENGEVQGRGNFYSGFTGVRPEWVRDHKIRFLLKLGPDRPELKDVPHIRQFLKPGSLVAKEYDVLESNLNVGQGFYAPPGVPKAQLAVLRKAFADMLKDPALKQEAESRRVPLNTRTPEEVQSAVDKGFGAVTPKIVSELATVMGYAQKKKKR